MFMILICPQDPLSRLRLEQDLNCLKTMVKDNDQFLSDLLRKYFVGNGHRLVMKMVADPYLDEQRDATEALVLDLIKKNLNSEELDRLVNKTKKIRRLRMEPDPPEAVAKLPKLPLSVVSKNISYPERYVTLSPFGIPVVAEELPTANIAYITYMFDLSELTLKELQLLPLADYVFFHGDSNNLSAEEKLNLFTSETGGVRTDVRLGPFLNDTRHISDPTLGSVMFSVYTKCLADNLESCLRAVQNQMQQTDFAKNEKFLILHIEDLLSQLDHALLSSPASIARVQLQSHMSLTGRLTEILSGLSSIPFLTETLARAKSDWTNFAADLEFVWEKVLRRENLAANIALNEPSLTQALPILESIVDDFSSDSSMSPAFSAHGLLRKTQNWLQDVQFQCPESDTLILHPIPSMVNYNLYGGRLSAPGEIVRHGDVIPATLLSEEYIIPHLRLVGGAYGASFHISPSTGTYIFSTYRDPNTRTSFDTFQHAPDALDEIARTIDQETIDQAIIAAISRIDAPQTNPRKAKDAFIDWMFNTTKEDKQRQKEDLFAVTANTFIDFSKRLRSAMGRFPKVAISVGKATQNDVPGNNIIMRSEGNNSTMKVED
eukprot:Gregarina_sp_Poly_1__9951@NODE_657_length_6915_cov_53_288989_g499_i0_p1_GENE_NODE_657_length_6915_cov_53_288989_g499_i0NODE_657_length_6915_cov_53_288989_g499_i0_p1_ORF_typecomplete_len604_score62_34M16C_assoc/PF08367_11/3_9e34Peptidase_M16_C/PF05193_21/3_5e03Peptidase_M16_C/PF05193_21/5_5Peptidase_M16_C/PF05193_21/10_NODE_657_length_6915_cov_53_288989_g499_i031524963